MMRPILLLIAVCIAAAKDCILPDPEAHDGPFQCVPKHQVTPDNHFNDPSVPDNYHDSRYFLNETDIEPNIVYQPRPIDIPFALLNFGNLNFFEAGQINWPAATNSTQYKPGINDFANQSACGIPDNAYSPSKAAIHPFWLKYAPASLGLARFCMQDICISIWNESHVLHGTTDIEVKVTDICSTEPSDPNYCATPADIMIDRVKAMMLYHATNKTDEENNALKHGKQYPRKVWWFFSPCLQDGLPLKAYNHSSNYFADPPLPNNSNASLSIIQKQQYNNNQTYPAAGLPQYQMGAYKNDTQRPPLRWPYEDFWKPGDKEPEWCPVAGGKGYGHPTGNCG